MPTETEIKLRVESHEPVRAALVAREARRLGRFLERNWILDHPDRRQSRLEPGDAGSLAGRGCALRVRVNTDEHGKRHGATLTYKGPRALGPFKIREELEAQVDDGERMVQILGMLGFGPVLEYEKRRESWELNGCRVELDEPPYLGLFVEIEGPDTAAIRRVQEALGLADAAVEPVSYPAMLIRFCEEHGIPGRALRLT